MCVINKSNITPSQFSRYVSPENGKCVGINEPCYVVGRFKCSFSVIGDKFQLVIRQLLVNRSLVGKKIKKVTYDYYQMVIDFENKDGEMSQIDLTEKIEIMKSFTNIVLVPFIRVLLVQSIWSALITRVRHFYANKLCNNHKFCLWCCCCCWPCSDFKSVSEARDETGSIQWTESELSVKIEKSNTHDAATISRYQEIKKHILLLWLFWSISNICSASDQRKIKILPEAHHIRQLPRQTWKVSIFVQVRQNFETSFGQRWPPTLPRNVPMNSKHYSQNHQIWTTQFLWQFDPLEAVYRREVRSTGYGK